MWVHNLNPVLFGLGPLEVRWYGLAYILGFFLVIFYLSKEKSQLHISKDDVCDIGFYILLSVLIGSRLFEIFWRPDIYLTNPVEILKIWNGGMSFHGGLVGIIVGTWYSCKKYNLSFWRIADILSVPTMIALSFGRIANFINGELVGRVFNGPWCVKFSGFDQCRHPSTLYAAGKRFLVAGWLLWLGRKNTFKEGFIFWNFVFFEGLGRFIVDFYREDVLHLGLSLGQWFSLIMIVIALRMFVKTYRKEWRVIFR